MTPELPLASIIIPSFNRRELLAEAVASGLGQSWPNMEVIVVDDGSTDGTEEFISRMIQGPRADRLRYTRQTRRGASCARNTGLGLARGQYIQFLDSDDLLYEGKILAQVQVLERAETRSAACCHCYGHMGPFAPQTASLRRIGCATTDARELVRELSGRGVHILQTSAPLWRRAFLDKHAGWRDDIVLGDDLEFHVRMLADAGDLGFVAEALFLVREHLGARLSSGISPAALRSLIRARRAIFATLQARGLWDARIQRGFLHAMRTIYANALQLGEQDTLSDLEGWLWELAGTPRRAGGFRALILLRRLLGRHVVLGAHKLLRTAVAP